jgi:hypothetical protein
VSKTLIVTNGPLTSRAINYIQFAPLGHVLVCRPVEEKISGVSVTSFILDELAVKEDRG